MKRSFCRYGALPYWLETRRDGGARAEAKLQLQSQQRLLICYMDDSSSTRPLCLRLIDVLLQFVHRCKGLTTIPAATRFFRLARKQQVGRKQT